MTKILILGDTHGSYYGLETALAANPDINIVYQLGDWGFMWAGKSVVSEINELLKQHNYYMFFHDGNHEDFRMLPPRDTPAPVQIADNITYMPRGCSWTWDGVKFLSLGGGVSIDKYGRKVGLTWFFDEEISEEEVDRACAVGKVDIMLTHDSPNNPVLQQFLENFGSLEGFFGAAGIRLEQESAANRERLDRVYAACQPKLVIHGHYHHRYSYNNADRDVTIVGLENADRGREQSWMVLDTDVWR